MFASSNGAVSVLFSFLVSSLVLSSLASLSLRVAGGRVRLRHPLKCMYSARRDADRCHGGGKETERTSHRRLPAYRSVCTSRHTYTSTRPRV